MKIMIILNLGLGFFFGLLNIFIILFFYFFKI